MSTVQCPRQVTYQRHQLQSWCDAHGFEPVVEFVESGASATDDRRPIFQQMIERACDGENVIIVHSYSRFLHEAFEREFYLRKLARHKVRVVSFTQPGGDENEPVHAMMSKVIAPFDEGKCPAGLVERRHGSIGLQANRS